MSKDVYKISGNDASHYEEQLGPLIFEPAAKELLSRIVAWPAQSILEIACGTGRVTRHLRANFPATTSIMATDVSPMMMELAQQQLNDPSVTFQLADALQLSFPDASFDLVVNQFGLMFFPDKQAGINEAFRILKPGGHFAFTTWDHTTNMVLFKLIFEDVLIPVFKDEDTTRFFTPFSLHDPGVLNSFLQQAGFEHYEVSLMKFKGRANSPAHIVSCYFLDHPLGRQVKQKFPASFDRVANELEQRLTQQFGAGAFDFELRAYIGIGRK